MSKVLIKRFGLSVDYPEFNSFEDAEEYIKLYSYAFITNSNEIIALIDYDNAKTRMIKIENTVKIIQVDKETK